ncbi:MAG: hypothetical protein U9R00_00190 [Patescibacteria group bacterium]|nr:hypothetical protein [Patescibacteria group bacterium]
MAPVSRDNILQLLKDRGPMVPNDIKKILGGDTIILGAMLAELSSRKLVKITHAKRGGSPFYYVPEFPEALETCFKYLSDQEQSVLNILKSEKVIQDNQLEVYQRVAIRQLKDFAKEFKANTTEGEILFWRYFLVSDDEAVNILNERHAPTEQELTPQKTIQEASETKEIKEEANDLDAGEEANNVDIKEKAFADDLSKEQSLPVEESDIAIENESEKAEPESESELESEIKEELDKKPDKESDKELSEEKEKELEVEQDKKVEEIESKEEAKEEAKEKNKIEEASDASEDLEDSEETPSEEPSFEKTAFYNHIVKFFEEKNIEIIKEEQLSKGKEYEFIVKISTSVGNINMLARAKNKKRLSENDVAPALLRAKNKDLFCLFLTPGEYTKKSEELISKEYTGLIRKQLPEFDN